MPTHWAAYEKVLGLDPDHAGALARKGLIIGTRRQYAQSFAMLDKALEKDPSNWNAMYGKGAVWKLKATDLAALDRRYDAVKAYDNALRAYDKAIELNPNNSKLWHEKGNVLKDLDRGNEAIRAFDRSIELDPRNTNSWYDKGVALKELGTETEATRCFERVLELDPTHTLARHKLKQL